MRSRGKAPSSGSRKTFSVGDSDTLKSQSSRREICCRGLTLAKRQAGKTRLAPLADEIPMERRASFDPAVRHQQVFNDMEHHVQTLLLKSEQVREQSFLYHVMPELADNQWSTARRHPTHPPEKFIEGAKAYRELYVSRRCR